MPYTIEWEEDNAVVIFDEFVNLDEMLEAANYLVGHRKFDHQDYQIWDLMKTKVFQVEDQDVEVIAAMDKSSTAWNQYLKLAIVTVNERVLMIARAYVEAMKNTNWEIKIFDNRSLANKWTNQK